MFIEMLSEAFRDESHMSIHVFKNGKDTRNPGQFLNYCTDDFKEDVKSVTEVNAELNRIYAKSGPDGNKVSTLMDNMLFDGNFKFVDFYKKYAGKEWPEELKVDGGRIWFKLYWKNPKNFVAIVGH